MSWGNSSEMPTCCLRNFSYWMSFWGLLWDLFVSLCLLVSHLSMLGTEHQV